MEPLSRPDPAPSERLRSWLVWFGVGRLVAATGAMLIVCLGAFWLVRSPVPPTEASLPMATTPPTVESTAPVATTPSSNPALVHVAGAVVAPGVYELAPGARIRDAIVAAGGATPEADADAINLAATVADGSRVYVPIVGEVVPTVAPDDPTGTPNGPVDVNRATAEELDRLPGVGPATAAAIVTERERNGPFVAVDDLDRVPGIGPAKLEALRDLVTT